MPFPLHKSPRGLLELLRLRTLGQQPHLFGETVTPVTDVTEFYAADLKGAIAGTAVAGSLVTARVADLVLTSPVRLHAISGDITAGAAALTNAFMSLGLVFNGVNGIGASLGGIFFPTILAGVPARWGVAFDPIVLDPSVRLRITAWGTGAGVDHTIQVAGLIDNITSTA